MHPLVKLFSLHGMKISNILEFEKIHGGSLRIIAIKDENTRIPVHNEIIQEYLDDEKTRGLLNPDNYLSLSKNALDIKIEIRKIIDELKSQGKIIAGYGAPVKGNTFVNYCGLTSDDLKYIIDDTLDKQGTVYAGTKIPIVSNNFLKTEKPDYLLILAWNFADEIMKKTKEFRDSGGKYVIAIPKPRIV